MERNNHRVCSREDINIRCQSHNGKTKLSPVLNHSQTLVKIFSYLNVEDLKSCRGVCRQWYKLANPILCPKMQNVYLTKTSTVHRFNKLIKYTIYHHHPFQRFTIHFSSFGFNLLDRNIQKFFSRCSPCIRELVFPAYNWSDELTLADAHYIIFILCPHLESLVNLPLKTKLTCQDHFQLPNQRPSYFEHLRSFTLYDNNWYTPSFVVELLQSMPHLKILKFRYPKLEAGQEAEVYDRKLNIFNIICNTYRAGGLRGLSCIDCDCQISTMRNSDIEKLLEINIPLKKLCAKVFIADNGETLYRLLERFSSTLAVLDLRIFPVFTSWPFTFPFLGNVTELTIFLPQMSPNILEKLPNLKHLKLENPIYSDDDNHDGGGISREEEELQLAFETGAHNTFENVITLKIPLVSPELFRDIIIRLPRLRKLEVTATDDMMYVIYEELPALESLKLVLSPNFTDAGFIGTDSSALTGMKMKDLIPPKVFRHLYGRPFIGYLKELRELELCLQYGPTQWQHITDVSSICGLLYLGKLTELRIPEGIDFGDKAFHALSYLPNLKVLHVPPECRISMGTLSNLTLGLDSVQVIVRTPAADIKQETGTTWSYRRVRVTFTTCINKLLSLSYTCNRFGIPNLLTPYLNMPNLCFTDIIIVSLRTGCFPLV